MISLQSLFGLDKDVHSQSIITVRYDFAQVHNVFRFYCYYFPNCNKARYPKYVPTSAEVNSMKGSKYSHFLTYFILHN